MTARSLDLATRAVGEASRSGERPGPESSVLKLVGTELNQKRAALMHDLTGTQGLVWSGEGVSADEIDYARRWLRSRANTIEGGTTEVQLNVIAKRILGLQGEN